MWHVQEHGGKDGLECNKRCSGPSIYGLKEEGLYFSKDSMECFKGKKKMGVGIPCSWYAKYTV